MLEMSFPIGDFRAFGSDEGGSIWQDGTLSLEGGIPGGDPEHGCLKGQGAQASAKSLLLRCYSVCGPQSSMVPMPTALWLALSHDSCLMLFSECRLSLRVEKVSEDVVELCAPNHFLSPIFGPVSPWKVKNR